MMGTADVGRAVGLDCHYRDVPVCYNEIIQKMLVIGRVNRVA
jgi:hypothetical protein